MAELRLSELALSDVESIEAYYENERPAARPGVMTALLDAFDQLEQFPASAPVALITRDGRTYRAAVAGSYLIYYREVSDAVFVARVWSARRRRLTEADLAGGA